MCEKCEQQRQLEETRERLTELALRNPRPCAVCGEVKVVGVGTWLPDERHYLAAGGTNQRIPMFSFWLCEIHAEPTESNEKRVVQSVLRQIRTDRPRTK